MIFTYKIWAKMSLLVMPKDAGPKDKGAGFVEYGALIIFVGIVAALLVSSGVADTIVQGINTAVNDALTPEGNSFWPFGD